MVRSITVVCAWCETKKTFDGDDPDTEYADAGWFQFQGDGEDADFCCKDCAVSWLT